MIKLLSLSSGVSLLRNVAGIFLLVTLTACNSTSSNTYPVPQTDDIDVTHITAADNERLQLYAAHAADYLRVSDYHIMYADQPAGQNGQAWHRYLEIEPSVSRDDWALARVISHEMCHAGQNERGDWDNFDWVSTYINRWHEIECKSIELSAATAVYAALNKQLPASTETWEDYYFHGKLLTEFAGKGFIVYYPEYYVTSYAASARSGAHVFEIE